MDDALKGSRKVTNATVYHFGGTYSFSIIWAFWEHFEYFRYVTFYLEHVTESSKAYLKGSLIFNYISYQVLTSARNINHNFFSFISSKNNN